MTPETAMEQIEEIRRQKDEVYEIEFLLRAFDVMREMAISLEDYGTINVDQAFEERMKAPQP